MARKLRIAVSVFFGVMTLALCVLWVRSEYRYSGIFLRSDRFASMAFESHVSLLTVGIYQLDAADKGDSEIVDLLSSPESRQSLYRDTFLGFRTGGWSTGKFVQMPYWFVVAVTTTAALVVPWNRARFSLRTLLIATTLVAAVLGLGVWRAR